MEEGHKGRENLVVSIIILVVEKIASLRPAPEKHKKNHDDDSKVRLEKAKGI